MGDLIEIPTYSQRNCLFYKVTSNTLVIEIKGSNNAAIGLATRPSSNCEIEIYIGNEFCWIKVEKQPRKKLNRSLLARHSFRKFLITWFTDRIQLSNASGESLINFLTVIPDIKYFTCFSFKLRNLIQWRFEIPPPRPIMEHKPITTGSMEWIPWNNQLPDGALIGGYEGENLYIIRSRHRGSTTPGKFVPSTGVGYVPWGGQSVNKYEFEVLCGYNCSWEPTSDDIIPVGAIVGGRSEDHEERLFIGRARHAGHLLPGKVQPTHRCCYVPYKGKEVAVKHYEILVNPDTHMSRACVSQVLARDSEDSPDDDSGQDDDQSDDNQPQYVAAY
ncbi:uncharacterized protein LOC105391281 [Plutella xylostella]|uniref:uncharacterized protein LOC105391281 n=1 Tax=Plutella xylostella TaxID=51655 RepID=UPI0020326D4E|nr:uncharacterized protein LOC105391281 [Plutella xylostella]